MKDAIACGVNGIFFYIGLGDGNLFNYFLILPRIVCQEKDKISVRQCVFIF